MFFKKIKKLVGFSEYADVVLVTAYLVFKTRFLSTFSSILSPHYMWVFFKADFDVYGTHFLSSVNCL